MEKWICCPLCGLGVKLFKFKENTRILGGGIEQKCRRCKNTILISEDGKTKVLQERSA